MSSNSPVREARIRAHLNVRQLMHAAGVSYDTVYRAERGERIGDLSAQKITDALALALGQPMERTDLFPVEAIA